MSILLLAKFIASVRKKIFFLQASYLGNKELIELVVEYDSNARLQLSPMHSTHGEVQTQHFTTLYFLIDQLSIDGKLL